MIILLVLAVAIGLLCYGFLAWARKQGYVTASHPAVGEAGRIPLVAEALAYVGVVLMLAGGIAAFARRWSDIPDWGHIAIFVGATTVFVTIGASLRQAPDPALQRLVDVVWSLSVAGVAGAAGSLAGEVWQLSAQLVVLIVGVSMCGWAALLWAVRRHAAEHGALFVSAVIATCGVVATLGGGHAPTLAFAAALWALGLVWAGSGWRGALVPMWVAMPLGIVLALIAPSIAVGDHGWVYALAIGTAGAVLVASVPLRNTPMLALGAVALFGYVTALVVRYFADSLGAPGALALTGVVVLVLAAVSTRLVRTMREREPGPRPPGRPVHHAR